MKISWFKIQADCKILCEKIASAEEVFEHVVLISRGGLFVGGLVAHLMGFRNIRTIAVKHYNGQEELGEIEELEPIPELEGNVLFIDDLVDSGKTLEFLRAKYGEKLKMKFGALYDKGGGSFRPDFCVEEVDPSEWIDFPWEVQGA